MSTIYVVGAFVLVVAIAVLISRRRGARTHYLEEWTLAEGEQRLRDPAADFAVIPRLGQARVTTFARRRRASVVVTERALIVGMKAAFSKRHVVTHLIHLEPTGASPAELGQLGGGLFTTGYIVFSARRSAISVEADGAKQYIRIVPDATTSATNVDHLRLSCDDLKRVSDALRTPATVSGYGDRPRPAP